MDYTRKIICLSDFWYNDGLKKAQERNMSGAEKSLRKSLKYDRGNAAARNLLGLLYFGVGETALALVEWIISKNIRPTDNIATYFISAVEDSPEELQVIGRAVKRYNKALEYCKKDDEDMAAIELKKAVSEHPSFLKAWQLLSLIQIKQRQYKGAEKSLKAARKLDAKNETTLRYLRDVSLIREISRKAGSSQEDEAERLSGNEMFFQPKHAALPHGRKSLSYLLVGGAVAAAVMWFLVFPAVSAGKAEKRNRQIVAFSERFNAMEAQISAQSRALNDYRKNNPDESGSSQEAALVMENYENLYAAKEQYESGKYTKEAVGRTLLLVKKDFLGDAGKKMYDELAGKIFPGTKKASASKNGAGENSK